MPAPSLRTLNVAARRRLIIAAALAAATGTAVPALAQTTLTEAQAIERALARPEVGSLGEANRQEAEARASGIRRFDNPEAQISRQSVSGDGLEETEWQAQVVQPIDLSGRRSRLRAAARAEVGAVVADTARRRQEITAEVRRAYVDCVAASERVRIAESFVTRLLEAERIVGLRARAGDAAVYDLRRLRVEARTAEAEVARQRGEVSASCATLAALTGEPSVRPAASLLLIAQGPNASTTDPSRPDLTAREQRVLAANEQLRAAERARIPELDVGVGVRRLEADGASATGPAVSLGVRLPLFDRGSAAVSETRARLRAQEAELALSRRTIDADIAAAEARSEAAGEAAARAQAAGDDARRLGPIAEAAYQGGEVGIVELVDAYRTARDAELEIIEQLERAADARVDLALARGGD